APAIGGAYHPLTPPFRMLDTRHDPAGPLPAHQAITTWLDFDTATNPHLTAFAVNITAVGARAPGYLTVWDGLGNLPGTSTLNFPPGVTVANAATVPVALCSVVFPGQCPAAPAITIYNGSSNTVHIIVDVFGVYDDSTLAGHCPGKTT